MMNRRKFRSQTSDLLNDEGRSVQPVRRERESQRRKRADVGEQVEKSRNAVFFPMFRGSGRWKSRLAKTAGAEPCGEMSCQKVSKHLVF